MADASVLGFTGTLLDPVTAAYPLGNGYRWFLPALMRFNAPDDFSPFGAGGINPYAYCADDPINSSDPSGHIPGDEMDAQAPGASIPKFQPLTREELDEIERKLVNGDDDSSWLNTVPQRQHPQGGTSPRKVGRASAYRSPSDSLPDAAIEVKPGPFRPEIPSTIFPEQPSVDPKIYNQSLGPPFETPIEIPTNTYATEGTTRRLTVHIRRVIPYTTPYTELLSKIRCSGDQMVSLHLLDRELSPRGLTLANVSRSPSPEKFLSDIGYSAAKAELGRIRKRAKTLDFWYRISRILNQS